MADVSAAWRGAPRVRTDGEKVSMNAGGRAVTIGFPVEGAVRIHVPGSEKMPDELSRVVDVSSHPLPCTVSVNSGAVVVSGGGCTVHLSRADGTLEIRSRDGAVHAVADAGRVRGGWRARAEPGSFTVGPAAGAGSRVG